MDANPFAPLDEVDRARAVSITTGAGEPEDNADILELTPWQGAVPEPHVFDHREHGEPAHVWPYRNGTGALVAVAARYDGIRAGGQPHKQVLPWSHGRRR